MKEFQPDNTFSDSGGEVDKYATFVNVILPLHLNQIYTYRVPAEWENEVETGKRVAIQFGPKKVYSGIIYQIHHSPPKNYEAKYIYSILDESPVVLKNHLQFWEWISYYYLCSLGDVMQAALPSALKLESATKIIANPSFDPAQTILDDKEFLIYEALELQHELTLEEISEIVRLKNIFPLVKSMVIKGMILMREDLEEKYREKKITCIRLVADFDDEINLSSLFNSLEKHEKQLNLLMAYLHLRHSDSHIERTQLLKTSGSTASPLQTLIKKGVFESYEISVDRIQIEQTEKVEFELNQSQMNAYEKICTSFEGKDITLLQGITGSGKTHVYVKLMEDALANNGQVLFLLPEIALTSQIIKRIRKYFGEQCISYHSKYNDQEKVEIWNKVKSGEYRIIIGARSAVFLPFKNLGLVIVDEEHENSYKQQDPAPRYHARDAALMLARQFKCKAILGSATPSLEVFFMALSGKYGWIKLESRFHETPLPKIETADLSEEKRTRLMKSEDITSQLFLSIEKALNSGEQVILFQNRRGYAPLLSCNTCNWVPKCKNCDISLTYHKYIDSLKCHYCGFTQSVPKSCNVCGSTHLSLKGVGTEKVEDELKDLFPVARVARLDLDAARTKHGHEEIIRNFEERKFDILVGTQMLSKGLDFDHVSLVGIINADQLLHFPDFRANERSIQLLLQVSGRAGRKHKQGNVIIQTSMPNHFVIQSAIHNTYEPLMERELEERQKFAYPPYFRLIRIVLKHKDFRVNDEAANRLKFLLQHNIKATILGPESPYVSRIRNFFIKELMIKVHRNNPELDLIKQNIRKCIHQLGEDKIFRSVIVYADVDPN